MAQLQFNETLYRLFTWKTGTYEFEQGPVHHDTHDLDPVRAESVLMEGFRMVDEWPVIRKRIPRYDLVFAPGKYLPPEGGPGDAAAEFASIGPSERRVFALVNGYRDVRKLIDLSCLGEFETCKALCNLVNLGHLTALMPVGEPDLPEDDIGLGDRVRGALGRLAVSMVVLAGIVGVLLGTQLNPWAVRSSTGAGFAEGVLRQQIARAQVSRIEGALAVYRLERGESRPRSRRWSSRGFYRPVTCAFRGRSVTTTAASGPRSSSSCRPCASLPGCCRAPGPGALERNRCPPPPPVTARS